MISAGHQLVAGRIPGQRIAESVITTNSAAVTSITTIASLTASLVAGRTYLWRAVGGLHTNTATTVAFVWWRENSTGAQMQNGAVNLPVNTIEWGFNLEFNFTAVSTGAKQMDFQISRYSGAGNVFLNAQAGRPTILSCEYLYG